ncbi:D-gamma-glutamyl-meso-diaminopimelic acid endopeptidase CwlS [Roseibium sp. TrichSKD4]|uniref:C40 family peptidase n=1 Tax=Roseibium sp. TrichSKD4 TaxID=744980 RepID=UPI0001E56B93|nr:NlpC/P60 family protein [Roseibium sp. TrichSKD4]EFO32624.1 D-gamma-glutamyl-meso-diaminopimelic acid endopeptidase CwlS [Roseibium sp. TrichSKD4]
MDRLVGVPYVAHGRSYEAADCWGLVWLYYRDVLQVAIPDYLDAMSDVTFVRSEISKVVKGGRLADWESVSEPKTGDVVLMRVGRSESHVGIYLDAGRVLHSEAPGDISKIERLDGVRLRNRVCGFFRLKSRT